MRPAPWPQLRDGPVERGARDGDRSRTPNALSKRGIGLVDPLGRTSPRSRRNVETVYFLTTFGNPSVC